MRKGQSHNPQTIEKLKSYWTAVQSSNGAPAPSADGQGPPVIDETAVIGWLNGLSDQDFKRWVRDNIVPRIKRVTQHETL